MQIKTLLNYLTDFQGFIFSNVKLDRDHDEIIVQIEPRKNSKPICSRCKKPGSTYDHLKKRRFLLPPIWGIAVVLLYTMRRVDCHNCNKAKVEKVPWATGKSPITKQFAVFLAYWTRKLSWKDAAESFHITWDLVATAVSWVVQWGLTHRDLEKITALGVDEIQYRDGQKYLTLVYQIDHHCRRLLWIGKERKKKTLHDFFDFFGKDRCQRIKFVCSDMWQAYISVINERLDKAVHILDRFHIVSNLNKVVDKIRRAEVTKLKQEGKPAYLKNSRWLLLRKYTNLIYENRTKLHELLTINLRTIKAYLFKEDFDHLWTYNHPNWAGRFIDQWTQDVMRYRSLPELKTFARTIREHKELILNYFRAKKEFSSGPVEGLNNKAKLTIRRSYGFRGDRIREIMLYHNLGKLPFPVDTHRFY
ncbi:MAG: ISL3 family transposase [Desulfobacterales bacterium]